MILVREVRGSMHETDMCSEHCYKIDERKLIGRHAFTWSISCVVCFQQNAWLSAPSLTGRSSNEDNWQGKGR